MQKGTLEKNIASINSESSINDNKSKLREVFLEPETRCDTYISKESKEAWKIRLDMLEFFEMFCERHELQWCVICGTMLGAIRHKGIIPWDEDLDLAMPRGDFNKFIELMQKDNNSKYVLLDSSNKDFFNFMVKLIHPETTEIDNWYASKHWIIPMGIHLDIHPIDGIPNNPLIAKIIVFIQRVLCNLYWASMDKPPFSGKLPRLLHITSLRHLINRRKLYTLISYVASLYPMKKCKYCGLMPYRWGAWGKYVWTSQWFDNYIDVPFEYLSVKVPSSYNDILTKTYGNWEIPVKGANLHEGSLYVDAKHSYKQVLPEKYARYGYKSKDFE